MSISDKIQSCHAKSFFVDGIVIERIIVGTARHANQCIVIFQCFCVAENERIVSWCNDDLITIGKFIV